MEHENKRNAVDKLFTWGSATFTPRWCQTEDHWTSRVTDKLFVDCPCCLLARGAVIGYLIGLGVGAAIGGLLF